MDQPCRPEARRGQVVRHRASDATIADGDEEARIHEFRQKFTVIGRAQQRRTNPFESIQLGGAGVKQAHHGPPMGCAGCVFESEGVYLPPRTPRADNDDSAFHGWSIRPVMGNYRLSRD